MAYHLKTSIAVAVSCLTMVFVLLISWFAYLYFEKEFKSATFQHISDNLDVTAESLSNKAHQALHSLELIRNSIPVEVLGNPVEMQHFLDTLDTELLHFDNGIILFSLDGKLLAVNPRQDDVIGADFSFRDYIKITLLNQQPYISAPIKSRQIHQHPIIVVTEPVFDPNDRIAGILAGSFDLYSGNFLDPLISNKIGEGGFYMVLDQQETMLVHPEKENILKPATDFFSKEHIDNFLTNSNGLITSARVNGIDLIGAYKHVSPLNWTVVALTPLEETFKPIYQARLYTLSSLATLFLIIIVAVRVLTNRLTSPLTELTNEVSLLASRQDQSINLKSEQYEEVGDLSRSIEILVDDLASKRMNLNEQLLFLQNLIDTIPSPIFYKDKEFRYLGCNKAFEEYLGVAKENLAGKSAYDIAPPELAKVYHQADQELWDKGVDQVYETSVKYADGSVHDVIFYKKIFKDTQGNPAGMIGTFLDITDRKRQETELHQVLADSQAAKAQVDNILRSAADGIVVTDGDGRVNHINQIAEEMLGFVSGEATGKPFLSMFDSKLKLQLQEFLNQEGLLAQQKDFVLNLSDAEIPRILQARSSILLNDDGAQSGTVILFRDVSKDRELDQLKNEFISTAAHEMRTPMSVLMGYIEILIDRKKFGGISPAQEKHFLEEAYSKGEALAGIINDLFDISRIEAGLPLPIEKTECDLTPLIENVASRYGKHSDKHTFAIDLADSNKIIADINKMSQVFENPISNAVKYSPDGGKIHIRSQVSTPYLVIEIEDHGTGMTEDQLNRVFDKFYRADSSNTAITGLGLGMSIVKTIIEGHDGQIEITSTPGKGTCVTLHIPVSDN